MEELKALDMGDNDRRIDLDKRKRRGGNYIGGTLEDSV